MRITSVLGNITTGTGGLGPQQMFSGYIDSQSAMISWFPPTSQTGWLTNAPDYYNVYRNGTLLSNNTGVWASPPLTHPGVTANATVPLGQAGLNFPIAWFVDRPLTAATTYTYTVTAVTGGIESSPGPALNVTTVANAPSAFPTPAATPESWLQPFALPTGNRWTVTQTTVANYNAVGGFGWALSQANPAGGDIIILPAGQTIFMPQNGAAIPAFTGTNGWTYIISSQDPVLTSAGTLPAYNYSTAYPYQSLNLTAAPALGATTATLAPNQAGWTDASGHFLQKTGWYYILVTEGSGASAVQEERLTLFTNGSAAITWANLNGLIPTNTVNTFTLAGGSGYTNGTYTATPGNIPGFQLTGGSGSKAGLASVTVAGGAVTAVGTLFGGYNYQVGDVLSVASASIGGTGSGFTLTVTGITAGGAGLNAAASTATIQTMYLNGVTPVDIPSMPTLSFGTGGNQTCISFHQTASTSVNKVRFVGINFQPTPGQAPSGLTYLTFTNTSPTNGTFLSCESIYLDRCVIGNDTNNLGWVPGIHSISDGNCNHFLMHQCYMWGIGDHYPGAAGDANINFAQGGWHCYQNCYLQATTESLIYGGIFTPPAPDYPHDIVIRYNFSHKPRSWLIGYSNPRTWGSPWWQFGQLVKDHYEFKQCDLVSIYGNLFLNCWMGTIISYHSGAIGIPGRGQVGAGSLPNTYCAWANNHDYDIHDNLAYYVGCLVWTFTGDVAPTPNAARLWVHNNQVLLSPLNNSTAAGERARGIDVFGPVVDFIIDHNTFISDTTTSQGTSGPQFPMWIRALGTNSGGYNNPSPYSPNGYTVFPDRMTWTNNILGTGAPGAATFNFLSPCPTFNPAAGGGFTNLTINKNLTINDTTLWSSTPGPTYAPGTFPNVNYGLIGFTSFRGDNLPPVNPADWNVVGTTYATASTTGNALGAIIGGTAFQITTLNLAAANVGVLYNSVLAASGGSGSYAWNLESASPNRHLWLKLSRGGVLSGTPQCDSTGQGGNDSIIVRCTDTSNGQSVTAAFTIQITTSGALTVTSPTTLPAATQNGGYAYQLIAQGGAPPYIYWQITAHTGSNTWAVTNNGWLYGVPTALSTDTVTVQCIDSANNQSTAVTFTISTSNAISLANVDLLNNLLKLPPAAAGQKYSHQLHAANGGSGAGQVFSIASGSLPSGLGLSAAGLISGTPAQTGNASCSIKCVDNAANTTVAVPVYLNVEQRYTGTKPTQNTATGVFFVDQNGNFCDPNGAFFQIRGINRNHYDQTFSGYNTCGCNSVRYTIFHTIFRGSTPSGAQSMATYAGDAVAQHTANDQFVIFTPFFQPGTTVNLTGTGTATDGGLSAAWWADNHAAWAASGLQGNAAINLQNEWGPTGAAFQNCYQAVNAIPITSVNTSTGVITLTSSAGSNPFANAASIGYAYISGGGINAAVTISATTGGSSGAWTITATTLSQIAGYTSGGTVSGGMVGIVRAAGYIDPIVIDCMQTGQHIEAIINYATAIGASDPLRNTIFSYHGYGTTVNYAGRISNIAGTNITMTSSAANNPMQPTATFANVNDVFVSGVTGTMGASVNGDQLTTSNGHGGSSGAWTVPLAAAPTGVYGGGGLVIPGIAAPAAGQNYHHPDRMVALFLAQRASGLCFILGEFGPGGNGGPSPTTCQYMEVVQACEAGGIGYLYWAMDDATPVGTPPGNPVAYRFGITGSVENGTYTVPTQLQGNGIDVVLNPSYGLHCLASPAPVYLP